MDAGLIGVLVIIAIALALVALALLLAHSVTTLEKALRGLPTRFFWDGE